MSQLLPLVVNLVVVLLLLLLLLPLPVTAASTACFSSSLNRPCLTSVRL